MTHQPKTLGVKMMTRKRILASQLLVPDPRSTVEATEEPGETMTIILEVAMAAVVVEEAMM